MKKTLIALVAAILMAAPASQASTSCLKAGLLATQTGNNSATAANAQKAAINIAVNSTAQIAPIAQKVNSKGSLNAVATTAIKAEESLDQSASAFAARQIASGSSGGLSGNLASADHAAATRSSGTARNHGGPTARSGPLTNLS